MNIRGDGTANHLWRQGTRPINPHAQDCTLGLTIHGRHAPLAVDVHDEVLAPHDFTSLDVNARLVAARDGSLTARDRPCSGQVPVQLIRCAAGGDPRQFAHFYVAPFIKHHGRSGRFLLRCRRQCFGGILGNSSVPVGAPHDELIVPPFGDEFAAFNGDALPRLRSMSPRVLPHLGLDVPKKGRINSKFIQFRRSKCRRFVRDARSGNIDGRAKRPVRQARSLAHDASPVGVLGSPVVPSGRLAQHTLLIRLGVIGQWQHAHFEGIDGNADVVKRIALGACCECQKACQECQGEWFHGSSVRW